MLKVKSLPIVLMFAVLAVWAGVSSNASAVTLTEEQKMLAAGLSDEEKADLARQAGIVSPASLKKEKSQVPAPKKMKARDVGSSNLEAQTGSRVGAADMQAVAGDDEAPKEEVVSEEDAEVLEVRRAFANFDEDAKPLTVDTDLRQFGYELFAGSPDTFTPATDVPVPAEYVLGPGDEINIHLYGRADEELVLVVDREGEIAFPSLGPLAVAGMGFAEAKAFIAQQVKEKLVGITADISMGKLRSIRIFALGDVERPGSYTVSGLSTISNALFVSGGIRKTGSLRNIQLKRAGQVMAVIDLYDFLLKGDTREDVRLLPGDVVFVPPIGKTAGVAGQVVRPAIYELKHEQSVAGLIGLSGGTLPTAYKEMALIERIAPTGGQSVIEISLSKTSPATPLKNGDLLKVFSVTDYENNPVYLLGHVKRPGKYAWHEGLELKEILPSPNMLLPEAKLDYGVIERESGIDRETSILHFNLLDAINGKTSIALEARDKVYVFKRAQLREMPVTEIVGSVQNPGKYEAKKNMRLWDLVMAAGGMKRDALLDDVELYRENPLTKDVSVQRYNLRVGPSLSEQDNPLLQDQDRVVIHSVWEEKTRHSVQVLGEVNNPGSFTLAEGMKLSDLIFAAGGVTERAYLKVAELTRYKVIDGEARVTTHKAIDLADALRGGTNDLKVHPFDVLMVRQLSNWREVERVKIDGEVRFPGVYPIEDGETLVHLIERAGGYTDRAYLPGSVFLRETVRKEQQKQMDDASAHMEESIILAETSTETLNNESIKKQQAKGLAVAKRVLEKAKEIKAQGRIVIELESIERMRESDFNLSLKDGDHLYIPKRPDQVLIVGQVSNTIAMLYRNGYELENYLNDAGGLTRMGDESEIYVVKANGRVARPGGGWGRDVKIAPGDTIVVPEKLEQFNFLDSSLDWSRVMSQMAISIASMVAIGIL